ncbi:MAG: hypothetical protein HY866_19045 [Chloroflexi bacterium]|nr:hypothetical protein [Chloroflexota bacterium]
MSENSTECLSCGIHTFSRNKYFNGKPLLERDFQAEQAYMVGKGWLHNSLLHGVGTVCGLKVTPHPNPSCRDRFVYIEPGMALDCCGRELVVPQRLLVRVQELIEENEIDLSGEEPQDLFIALCYEEHDEEPIPVLLPTCDCAGTDQGFNRIRETVRVHLFARPSGEQLPVRPPLDPRLEWMHTLTLEEQSPRAVAVDDQLGQVYVAAQGISSEEDGARLYVFDMATHNIITAADAASNPTDVALSLLGDRIYVAAADWNEDSPFGIGVFEEAQLRIDPDPTALIELEEPARLAVSPQTGALFVLLMSSGRLWTWSDEAIRNWLADPTPSPAGPADRRELDLGSDFSSPGGAAERGGALLDITRDGRYLFVADPDQGVRVVDVATFTEETPSSVDSFGVPVAVRASNDSEFVYVLWQGEGADSGNSLISRYRIDNETGTLILARDGRGGRWPGTPLDLALAPAERFAYVLQTDNDLSEVVVISVDAIATTAPDEPVDARMAREDLSGAARFERLNLYGQRLYVAADAVEADVTDTARGLVIVLDVNENSCGDLFDQVIESCPACAQGDNEHCVVLAHLPDYVPERPIQAADEAADGDNTIDNLTHRPIVPSSQTIVEVIRCMLEQGFAEGVPGPRGPAGEQGTAGQRGPGIVEAVAQTLNPGSAAAATLQPIAGDPEGDQRLVLGIPRGQSGPRGPGITQVTASTLAPGSAATAALQPIAGDPEGDQRLLLGIPRGDPAVSIDPVWTRVNALSWQHNIPILLGEFIQIMVDPLLDTPDDLSPRQETGLVIEFTNEVIINTIFGQPTGEEQPPFMLSEVFQLYLRFVSEQTGLLCECLVPNATYQAVNVLERDGTGRITVIEPLPPETETAAAVRLVFMPQNQPPFLDTNADLFFRVVLRADFVLDTEENAVDGNFLGARLPSGNGRQGDAFESWFRVTRGN